MKDSSRYGPAPTGFWAIPFSPCFSTAAGETSEPEPWASELRSWENGALVRITTVCSSTTSAPATGSQRGRLVGFRALSISRSTLNLTAWALNGVPSWKRTFFRSRNRMDLRSGATSHASASWGTNLRFSSKSTSRS